MKSEDIKSLVIEFDPMVKDEFKNSLVNFLKMYSDNPTKSKLKCLILNLPIGSILNQKDLDKFVGGHRFC